MCRARRAAISPPDDDDRMPSHRAAAAVPSNRRAPDLCRAAGAGSAARFPQRSLRGGCPDPVVLYGLRIRIRTMAAKSSCQSEDRRSRRLRLHRLGTGAPAAAPSARRDRAAHGRPPGRAGDARGVSAVLAVQAAEARLDRKHRLEEGRARSRVLRAAACHHAEGDERSAGQGAEDQGGRSLAPTSGCTIPRPMRAGTATSITRRNCRRRRSTAWSRSTARRSRRRGSSPIPAATPPARSLR